MSATHTRQRRPKAVTDALLSSLPQQLCECGHTGVKARDFYKRNTNGGFARGDWCVDCYREHYRNAARAARGSSPRPALKTAGHSVRRPKLQDPEVQAALGVLKDARAQKRGVQGWVYLIYEVLPGGGLHYGKIGYSTNPRARVAELQTGNPRPLMLGGVKKGTEADEKALHTKYHAQNVLQEWFTVSKELALEFNPPKTEVDLP